MADLPELSALLTALRQQLAQPDGPPNPRLLALEREIARIVPPAPPPVRVPRSRPMRRWIDDVGILTIIETEGSDYDKPGQKKVCTSCGQDIP